MELQPPDSLTTDNVCAFNFLYRAQSSTDSITDGANHYRRQTDLFVEKKDVKTNLLLLYGTHKNTRGVGKKKKKKQSSLRAIEFVSALVLHHQVEAHRRMWSYKDESKST